LRIVRKSEKTFRTTCKGTSRKEMSEEEEMERDEGQEREGSRVEEMDERD